MEYAVTGEMTKLTKAESGTTTLTQTNVYDHNGQRIERTENGSELDYYYDQGVMVYTIDGSNVCDSNVLSEDGAVIGTYRSGTYYNYLKDIQGSTTNIIKEDGTLSTAYDYTDFGETTAITGAGFDNQICYTGGVYDKETGLYYLNARYYDPEIGRFISQDSYRGELNDPGQWHLYVYCANNPINYVDPSGHAWVSKTVTKTCGPYPIPDASWQAFRVNAKLSVEYSKKNTGKKTIKKMKFIATGDKHSMCENGTCLFVNVKMYKNDKCIRTIKGTSVVVKNGDGVILDQYSCLYTDKKIDKNYAVGKGKIKVKAKFAFTPPNECSWGSGMSLFPTVKF